MLGCYGTPTMYSYSPILIELEVGIVELERIAGLRRYEREALLELVEWLRSIKETIRYELWSDVMELDVLEHCIRFMEDLCVMLEKLWMRRRRMRKALIKVGCILDHSKNKMKCNLMKIK